jgi:hypothetical protein
MRTASHAGGRAASYGRPPPERAAVVAGAAA